MARVINSVAIRGPVDRVFDIVTTPKFWPQWNPPTIGVSGETEQPMQRGTKFRERFRIAGIVVENAWEVAALRRPTRVVLRTHSSRLGHLEVAYRFRASGDHVELTHEINFSLVKLPSLTQGEIQRQLDADSEIGLPRLKRVVEEILAHG